ncbi:cellulose binding domain-containing protein [Micromonospora yasonensis]|uniref:SRPBCC domain-containing protein n=1 Tax=Micromonospora yasonensis TaxID=1128667 RepID=UPI002230CEFE|nr:SRPBCC domain-containing protein [Micromonospora yasonensis]MCW3845055.1 cellulose binding domain-containing protein [Micromonospora yasonensis]
MIEIDTEVELFHPADRVWQALTDRGLVAKWFAEATPAPDAPDRLLLRTAGLPGFDADVEAEVAQLRVPELLVLRCQEGGRRTLLTATLVPTGHGCRLTVGESLEHGEWDADARAEHHQQAVTVRLPAILDWLAFQQVDLRRADGGLTAELPLVRTRAKAGRRRAVLISGLGCLALAGGLAVWVTRPEPPAPAPVPEATPLVMPSSTHGGTPAAGPSRSPRSANRSSATAAPSPSATPSRTRAASASPVALAATYRTVADRVFGYRGEVVVSNPGGTAKQTWTVVVTVASGATVGNVNGATATQDGEVVTFTGPAVPPGATATIRFDVRDPDPRSQAPKGCTVDGSPCAGL